MENELRVIDSNLVLQTHSSLMLDHSDSIATQSLMEKNITSCAPGNPHPAHPSLTHTGFPSRERYPHSSALESHLELSALFGAINKPINLTHPPSLDTDTPISLSGHILSCEPPLLSTLFFPIWNLLEHLLSDANTSQVFLPGVLFICTGRQYQAFPERLLLPLHFLSHTQASN